MDTDKGWVKLGGDAESGLNQASEQGFPLVPMLCPLVPLVPMLCVGT